MALKQLNLTEIYEVYRYLEKGLERAKLDAPWDQFIVSLLEELKKEPEQYIRILQLLTGYEKDTILRSRAADVVIWFIQGLQENKIMKFAEFFRDLSKDYGPF
jgi:hypothetical protein